MRVQEGLTLLELLIGVAMLAVLVTVGLPAFTEMQARTRLTSMQHRMASALQLARSEAVKGASDVVLCAGDENGCGGTFGDGWIVFPDLDGDRRLDEDEPVLLQDAAAPGQVRVDVGRRKIIRFQRDGGAYGSTATIRFCDAGRHAGPVAVIVANSGRIRQAEGERFSCR